MKEALFAGNYREACQQARLVLEKGNKNDHTTKREAVRVLARGFQRLGQYELAIPYAKQEIDLSPNDADRAQNWITLADIYFESGDQTQGYASLQRGFCLLRNMKAEESPAMVSFWLALSRMYRTQKKWQNSLNSVEHALAIVRRMLQYRERIVYFTLLLDKGICCHQLGRMHDSLGCHWEAKEGFMHLLGDEHPSYGTATLALGHLYYVNHNFTAALPLFREGLTIYSRIWGPTHSRTEEVRSSFALCRRQIKATRPRGVDWTIYQGDNLQCMFCHEYFAVLATEKSGYCDSCFNQVLHHK